MSDVIPFVSAEVMEELEWEDESHGDRQATNSHLEDVDQNNTLHGHVKLETIQDKLIFSQWELIIKEVSKDEELLDMTCDQLIDVDECHQTEEINHEDEPNTSNAHLHLDLTGINNNELIQLPRRNVPVENVTINARKATYISGEEAKKLNNVGKLVASNTCKCETNTQIKNIKRHTQVQLEEKQFKCDICRKCFGWKHHLKRHVMIHTGEKPFKCDHCEKYFTQKCDLKNHLVSHTGEKPFQCDTCLKCYHQKSDLNKHLIIHTGEKPFQCDTCEKCFTHKKYLKRHMKVHTEEKPFKCDICVSCFTQKGHLKIHMTVHTGEKPFKCDTCLKCFSVKERLNKHVRIHSGVKPYKCEKCGKCFTWNQQLKGHMKSHTGEKEFKAMSDLIPFVPLEVKELLEDESHEDRQSNNSHLEDIDQNNALEVHVKLETIQAGTGLTSFVKDFGSTKYPERY